MTIREILNMLLWNARLHRDDYEVIFTHRGEYGNQKIIPFTTITMIHPSSFTYVNNSGKETTIPFQRILEIRDVKTNASIWKKREEK